MSIVDSFGNKFEFEKIAFQLNPSQQKQLLYLAKFLLSLESFVQDLQNEEPSFIEDLNKMVETLHQEITKLKTKSSNDWID